MTFHSTFKNIKKFTFYMTYFLLTFYTASTLIAFTSPSNATIEESFPAISKQPSVSKCTHCKPIIYDEKPITQEPNSINRLVSTPIGGCKARLICLCAGAVTAAAAAAGTVCNAHGYKSANLALHVTASALTSISSSTCCTTCTPEKDATVLPKELTACCCAGFIPSIVGTGIYLSVAHGVGCGSLGAIAPSAGGALSLAGQFFYAVLCLE